MNTNFKVIGLTRLGITPKFAAPGAGALTYHLSLSIGVADHLSTTPRWGIPLPLSTFSDPTNSENGGLLFILLLES